MKRYNPNMPKSKKIKWAKKHEGLVANILLLTELTKKKRIKRTINKKNLD